MQQKMHHACVGSFGPSPPVPALILLLHLDNHEVRRLLPSGPQAEVQRLAARPQLGPVTALQLQLLTGGAQRQGALYAHKVGLQYKVSSPRGECLGKLFKGKAQKAGLRLGAQEST